MVVVRFLGYALLGFLVVVAIGFGVATWVYRDIPAEELEAKYGGRKSEFVEIDGVRMHIRDEGEGPAIVLIHAHWASLIMWDAWADELKDSYRVIRFDMTGHGLTGPDPSGDYTLERSVDLVEKLRQDRGIEEMYIGGISMGGTIAIRYAAQYPERVEELVLLNPGALNERVRGRDKPPELPWWIDILKYVTPRAIFSAMLNAGFGENNDVPEDLITRWHDMQLREGQREAELSRQRQYVSGDVEGIIRSLKTPTLIMWGESNQVVPVEQAYELVDIMENTETQLVTFPGVGHMTVLEAPDETAQAVRLYLDSRQIAPPVDMSFEAIAQGALTEEGEELPALEERGEEVMPEEGEANSE